jgi:Protein of unknown function (DUF2845)
MRLTIMLAALLFSATALADETFRCGKWIITAELSLSEIEGKCGAPTSKTSEVVEVRGKVGTGSVSRGTSVVEHWVYVLGSGAHYEVTVVDGDVTKVFRAK